MNIGGHSVYILITICQQEIWCEVMWLTWILFLLIDWNTIDNTRSDSGVVSPCF